MIHLVLVLVIAFLSSPFAHAAESLKNPDSHTKLGVILSDGYQLNGEPRKPVVSSLVTVNGGVITASGLNLGATVASGTAASGCTAVETGAVDNKMLTLDCDITIATVANGAALGAGTLLYTLNGGSYYIASAHLNGSLLANGEILADTPDVGVGTTIASGAVSLLSGTAAFENIITGQTAAGVNGQEILYTDARGLAIYGTSAQTIYLNFADTWAANGDQATAVFNGELLLELKDY